MNTPFCADQREAAGTGKAPPSGSEGKGQRAEKPQREG